MIDSFYLDGVCVSYTRKLAVGMVHQAQLYTRTHNDQLITGQRSLWCEHYIPCVLTTIMHKCSMQAVHVIFTVAM